jgi:transcriptional regulator with XRE-family HTH domain
MKVEECKDRHVNISEIARRIGYSRSHINGVISGRYRPSKRFLRDLEPVKIEDVLKHYYRQKPLNK